MRPRRSFLKHFMDQVVWPAVVLFGVLFAPGSSGLAEAACGGSPTVTTDKPDYGPTETVVVSGAGFNCGEWLFILVTAPDGSTRLSDGTGAAGPDSVVTDGNGVFGLTYHLSGTLANGSTYQGQLGIYRVEVRDASGELVADANFSDALQDFSCALTTAGGVKCWGSNAHGQLGNGTLFSSPTPVEVSGLSSVVQITVSQLSNTQISAHACALTALGGVKCWGSNSSGQLGNGTFVDSATPVDVIGLTSGVAQVNAGAVHTCAVTAVGSVKCWGSNFSAQLGNGTLVGSATPVDVVGLMSGVAQVSAGGGHTCAVTAVGSVKCWGRNDSGQLGNGRGYSATPVDVIGLTSSVAQVSGGYSYTCVAMTDGDAKCWGDNSSGQLGNGTFGGISTTPVGVAGLTSGVVQFTAGVLHTCAVTTSGGLKCWGGNPSGALGDGSFTNRPTPVDVLGLTSEVAQVSAGYGHTCAVTTGGGAKCWGYNGSGELGDGGFTTRATPAAVKGLTHCVTALWDGEGRFSVPTACPAQAPAANANGWNNTNVTVSWSWIDRSGSGIDDANCTSSSTSAGEGNPIVLTANCKDLAGNTGNTTYSVKVDKTAPTVSAAAVFSPNANGWYKTDVYVRFTCKDSLSGIATSCPFDQRLTGDGVAVASIAQTVSDKAGNLGLSNIVTVSIDRTPPLVALIGGPANGGSYYFGAVPLAPTCSASDALSGLDICSVSVYSGAIGSYTVTATAVDKAGNASSTSASYTVLPWALSGFYQPVDMGDVWNTVKNGSTVPIKFEVFAGSTELTDPSIVIQPLTAAPVPCNGGLTDDIQLLATGRTSLRYDTVSGQFIYNWQTPTTLGTCYSVTVTLADGTSRSANFQLR